MSSLDELKWLQEWYVQNCDGEWEQRYGIELGTLDNPGWFINIDLAGTALEDKRFVKNELFRSENDWVNYDVKNNVFIAAGGPLNLDEIIGFFRKWYTESTRSTNHEA